MKTKAAVLRGVGQDFEITELDLDPPKAGEVLIRYVAAGCATPTSISGTVTSCPGSRSWAATRARESSRRLGRASPG